LRLELQETVLRAAQHAAGLAQEALEVGTSKKGPGQVRIPPEPTVLAASSKVVIVELCAKLQDGLVGFCENPDAEYATYVEAWKGQATQGTGAMGTPASWALKKVADSLMEMVQPERPANKHKKQR
ncbi:MAG: hypothetical protein ACKPKO_21085, partial [Candidatus Fonsibacter sp.]